MEPPLLSGPEKGPVPPPPNTPHHIRPVHSLLELIEDALIRMIKGIIRFIFVRVPVKIYELLNRIFPTLVKLIKVLFLLLVWGGIAFVPIVAVLYWYDSTGIGQLWAAFVDAPWFEKFSRLFDVATGLERELAANRLPGIIAWIWIVLFIAGSIWGLLFAVRRRRGERRGNRRRRGTAESPDDAGESRRS